MKDKDKDIVDELFRSKLYDFEVDTMPDDWDAIADRLPGKAPVSLRPALRYWAAAAAVISLLMVIGSIYIADRKTIPAPIAQEIEQQTEALEQSLRTEKTPERHATEETPLAMKSPRRAMTAAFKRVESEENIPAALSVDEEALAADDPVVAEVAQATDTSEVKTDRLFRQEEERSEWVAQAAPVTKSRKEKEEKPEAPARKWGFGMGAGGLSVGADNMVPQYVTNSTSLRSESLMLMNAPYFNNELPKTDIRHKTPISFGLSVSRYLNSRFALQTGLTYSFLSSEWTTNGDYHGKTKQKLHFIGIPLSLTYKIAEWNRFNFYAAAGVMAELNVAGTLSARLYNDNEEMVRVNERVRMKELLWSTRASVGVSYPVIRFVSAFAEVGAAYYFDNGSRVETVHSEKPFNVSLQLGFRLGF